MSVTCGLECVVCFGCTRWAWKRCTYIGAYDSENWPPATPEEFEPIPRICAAILAVYETDLENPKFIPPDAYRVKPELVVKRVSYEETEKKSPPYLIYVDSDHKEIVLAIRGLNLVRDSDYKVIG
jgi:Lipase 3 N-terminal region